MPTLLAAHAGSRGIASEIAELRATGFVTGTDLAPLVRRLVDVVAEPTLVVSVEVTEDGVAPRLFTFWSTGRRAALGHCAADDRFELTLLQPGLLPFHVAQAVQLTPRRHPAFAGSVSIPQGLLGRAEDLIELDPTEIATKWRAAGVTQHWVDRIVAAVIMRRAAWTIESVWIGGTIGSIGSRLEVLDGGHAGYWTVKPSPSRNTVLAPIGFDDLLNRIAALLPAPRLRR
ncbi:MAG: ESX secretion-associated protein EspG [Acidimicrobiia bacterium]|nr:ESX secretion-associated protein EspG [Acidimicrobiia bacterium]